MGTVYTMMAFDRECTTYRRVDGDSDGTVLPAFIVVDHVTNKVGHGPTERAAHDAVRRACQLENHDGVSRSNVSTRALTRASSRVGEP
jgi:hypothetical protein